MRKLLFVLVPVVMLIAMLPVNADQAGALPEAEVYDPVYDGSEWWKSYMEIDVDGFEVEITAVQSLSHYSLSGLGQEAWGKPVNGWGSFSGDVQGMALKGDVLMHTVEAYDEANARYSLNVTMLMTGNIEFMGSAGTMVMSMMRTQSMDVTEWGWETPMEVGDAWTVEGSGDFWEHNYINMSFPGLGIYVEEVEIASGTVAEKTSYECLGVEDVTVGAGTFRGFKVKETKDGEENYTVAWYADEVGGIVKERQYDKLGNELKGSQELLDYHYPGKAATVSGQVLGAEGTAISNATVTVSDAASGEVAGTTFTDGSGSYVVELDQDESTVYSVRIEKEGYVPVEKESIIVELHEDEVLDVELAALDGGSPGLALYLPYVAIAVLGTMLVVLLLTRRSLNRELKELRRAFASIPMAEAEVVPEYLPLQRERGPGQG